ncbi:RHS repeat domain-containing protein [Shimia sediminis]|uniref:RHS repeat domain-containing protein n=1 Tax=Shimia sediminis TaxID=2497945 RepID=UPI00197FC4B8|nr:RHS repeat-associated core domain-containing protein [Shimia sediminis]
MLFDLCIAEYIWLGLEPVAAVSGGNVYFIRTDHIGKPVLATDSLGVVASTLSHKPFGAVHTSTGLDTGLRFPGQVYHCESELHQNWMREYDPTTGRYIQGDPLGLVDGASVYAYALQSPGRFIDPRGEQSVVFDGSSVNTFDSSGRQISSIPAVSGRPESCQCSDDMYKSNFGPTPEGSYSVDPNAINRWNVFKAVTGWGSREAWGKQRTILVPDGHTAGGRTQMYIHGGEYP